MNRKGDVSTFLIIPIAFVLMSMAFFSFLSYDENVENSSREISEVLADVGFYEKYIIEEARLIAEESVLLEGDLKEKYQQIAKERDIQIAGAGNFFGKIRNGEFVFERRDGKYFLEVNGLFVQSEKGENRMKRVFDMRIVLNEN